MYDSIAEEKLFFFSIRKLAMLLYVGVGLVSFGAEMNANKKNPVTNPAWATPVLV